MTGEPTPGVLLKGKDGTHYFIPQTDLSGYAVSNVPEPLQAGPDVSDNVPRLPAFSVHRVAGASDAAQTPMPEGGSEAVVHADARRILISGGHADDRGPAARRRAVLAPRRDEGRACWRRRSRQRRSFISTGRTARSSPSARSRVCSPSSPGSGSHGSA